MDRYFVTHYFWLNGDIYLPAETNARYRRLAMLDFGGFHNRIRPPFSQPCLILIHIDTYWYILIHIDTLWRSKMASWKIPIDIPMKPSFMLGISSHVWWQFWGEVWGSGQVAAAALMPSLVLRPWVPRNGWGVGHCSVNARKAKTTPKSYQWLSIIFSKDLAM